MIVSGAVDVMIEEGGAPKYLNILGSGQGFGEVALVNKVSIHLHGNITSLSRDTPVTMVILLLRDVTQSL